MAKHRKKQPVYYNNGSDTWTNDDKEQLSLALGSDGYEARQQSLSETNPMSEQNIEENVENQENLTQQYNAIQSKAFESDDFDEAFTKGQKSSSAMQYRASMQRQDAVKETAKIASDGLGHAVSTQEIESQVHGLATTPEQVPKALVNYKKELEEREVPKIDLNGDGKIDEDDIYTTPGMNRMKRYL